ncbi:MAG: hypothetical protein ABFS56_17770 [Pseudomonadota bacterium]
MTQNYTLILILSFTAIMLWLAVKDQKSFLRGQPINYKTIIVSIGMLGTFLGILLGLLAFDSEHIRNSVPQLLEGLKLAFITSIIGMGLSLLLSLLQAKPDEKSKPDPIAALLSKIKQQLESLDKRSETLNETVAAILEKNSEPSKTEPIKPQLESLDKRSETLNETVAAIL